MPETDFIVKSVTAGDAGTVQGGVMSLIIPQIWGNMNNIPIPPQQPVYWSPGSDVVLRATVHAEAMWAAAVGIAISQTASKAFEIKTNQPRKAKKFQELFLYADGRTVGWVSFLSKHLRDFLCSNNGAFVEIVRANKSHGSEIIGIRHLDSARCSRTGDPDIPLLYRDRKNKVHELKNYQCMLFSDMPDPSEMYYGVGLCAAARSYPAIYKLATMEWYLREKVGGLRPLAIYIVNGLLQQQVEGAVKAAQEQTVAKGLAAYMGAVMVGIPGDKSPEVATIPLAELPDRFDRKEEFDIAILTYANNLGLDPQELQPLSGSSLGTGAQSQVLHDKAMGKGLAAWQQQWTHQVNELILPETVIWQFIEKDIRDMKAHADYEKVKVETAKAAVEGGILMPEQAVQVLVDDDILPREFLPKDATGEVTLTDPDKLKPEVKPAEVVADPLAEADAAAEAELEEVPVAETPVDAEAEKKQKEWEVGLKEAKAMLSKRKVETLFERAHLSARLKAGVRKHARR